MLIAALACAGLARARPTDVPPPQAPPRAAVPGLFDSDEIIDLTLRTDLPTLMRDRSKSYHPAALAGGDPSAPAKSMDVEVSTRGMTSLRSCQFPHLRFKLKPEAAKGTLFENLTKLKTVTHCNNPDIGDAHTNEQREVILQYMVYRMYSILTDYSFKARLVRMHYEDESGQMQPLTKYAFFIEPLERVATRHSVEAEDREELNQRHLTSRDLNAQYTGLAAAFEFMVGNGDWRVFAENTVSFLNMEGVSGTGIQLLPIPYDFDRSGMCNGQFAFHSVYEDGSTFPIVGDTTATMSDIYRQVFEGKKLYNLGFSLIREKEQQLLDLYAKMGPLIDARFRARTVDHLKRFFQAISERRLDAGDLLPEPQAPVTQMGYGSSPGLIVHEVGD